MLKFSTLPKIGHTKASVLGATEKNETLLNRIDDVRWQFGDVKGNEQKMSLNTNSCTPAQKRRPFGWQECGEVEREREGRSLSKNGHNNREICCSSAKMRIIRNTNVFVYTSNYIQKANVRSEFGRQAPHTLHTVWQMFNFIIYFFYLRFLIPIVLQTNTQTHEHVLCST